MNRYFRPGIQIATGLAVRRAAHPMRCALQAASVRFLPFALLIFIGIAAQDAAAQITEIRVDQIDNSSGGPALDGFVTNDVVISFDGQYTGSQLLVVLDQGSIYQDPDGDITVPEFTSSSVEFDTFVTHGLPAISDINYAFNGNILGAINLGGAHPGTFDAMLLNIAWHPPGGTFIEDLSDFLTARISLSDDASGGWAYLASARQEITIEERIIQGGVVQNGALLLPAAIPEPATCSLAAIAAAAGLLYIRRRRR